MACLRALCLVWLVLLAAILEVQAKGGNHCPKKRFKFERRIRRCYHPLTEGHDSTDPQYCRDYQRILRCVTRLSGRCQHRHWMQHKKQDMDKRVAQLTHMITVTC